MVHATEDGAASQPRVAARAPAKIWQASEPPFHGAQEVDASGYAKSDGDTAIVIDNGSSRVRAGWSFDTSPRIDFPPLMARYTDRRIMRTYKFVGSSIFADGTARGQSKNVYEPGQNVINNWDCMEGVLDYIFIELGLGQNETSNGSINRPIVMTEPVANLGYSRKTMNELLFECYQAPKVAYGIDSLFSYDFNGGRNGLVLSSAYTATHVIPVYESKPLLSYTSRLNWGRWHTADFLNKLLRLKYPAFPARITDPQLEDLVKDHCYVSRDYDREIGSYLDWQGLEERSHIIQWPFQETVVPQKTEEELAKAAERKKESGRRLQEQAAKMRLDKLVRKEQELEYYKDLQQRLVGQTKKETKRMLESDDFDDEDQLTKRIRDMERSIRKARNKDVGDLEEEPVEAPTYALLDVPDAELDEEGLKQKRHQRLLKSNHDARARAKAEKEREKQRKAEEERLDRERREADPETWLSERRVARQAILQRMRERERLKADLSNRKSLASQMRMKSIANLASDNVVKKRRRGERPAGEGGDDNFGADDADWGVYRTIGTGDGGSDEENEDEDIASSLRGIEAQLLEHDPDFTEENTRAAQSDWTASLLHAFLRGPWPSDPESQREQHQIQLNVERIRVPEIVFQPAIAGVDQAGIVEICSDILTSRLQSPIAETLLQDVFLCGGNTLFEGFEDRLRNDLRAFLPAGAPMGVRRAKDPLLDAWRGAARWGQSARAREGYVTRQEYEDKGSEYMKEHGLGNAMGI